MTSEESNNNGVNSSGTEQTSVPQGNKKKKGKASSKKKQKNKNTKKKSKDKRNSNFKGKFESMKGHVFQLRSETKSLLQFSKTMEQLVRWATLKFKYSDDIKWMLKNLEDRVFSEPEIPVHIKNDKVRERVFDKMIDLYVAKEEAYGDQKSDIFEVIWGQCSEALHSKIETNSSYKDILKVNDCVELLKVIKKYMYSYNATEYEPIIIYNAKLNSLLCKQGTKESVNNYYNRLKGMKEVLSYHKCSYGDDYAMVYYEMKEAGVNIDENVQR